ncbi:hypothetical protein D3C71_1935970 [compost metagenome]
MHAPGLEVGRHVKGQAVGPHLEGVVVKQRRVGAAVVVQNQAFDQGGLVAFGGEQLHRHARSGAAIHGVENVGAEAHREIS